jgi:predicted RNase H-like nuclease
MSKPIEPSFSKGVGVDGCKAGWIAVDRNGAWLIASGIYEVLTMFDQNDLLVDMPVGLSGEGVFRTVETQARPLLGSRSSTLFTPPCRQAVHAHSYEEANRINRVILGKGISIQCWNIVPRIRELDTLLHDAPVFRNRIFEAHPELCFVLLNNNKPLQFSKKHPEGRKERLDILMRQSPEVEQYFFDGMKEIPRKHAAPDDLLDALCLSVVANGSNTYLNPLTTDADGISINLRIPS